VETGLGERDIARSKAAKRFADSVNARSLAIVGHQRYEGNSFVLSLLQMLERTA
jgi:hypothetical protein